jgi:hypothetical protein
MNDVVEIERDRGGRFITGGKPGPGRPRGSRSVLATRYCDDLLAAWEKHGKAALEATATLDPVAFVRAIGQILPRDVQVDLDVTIRAQNALEAFRMLRSLPRDELLRLRQVDADTE